MHNFNKIHYKNLVNTLLKFKKILFFFISTDFNKKELEMQTKKSLQQNIVCLEQ